MTKPLHKRPTFFACLLLLLVLLVPVLLTWRQVQLDHALIAHIKADNTDAVITDLRQGADANAIETLGDVPSIGQMLRAFFQHRSSKPQRVNTALAIAFKPLPPKASRRYGIFLDRAPPPARNIRLIKALLDCGANPNVESKDGQVPLENAAEYGDKEIVQMLLNKGAHVNQQTIWRGTPRWQPVCVCTLRLSDSCSKQEPIPA